MDAILFLKTNHLDSETRGYQKKRERGSRDSEGPDTVINVSKKAAGLQPFITQSGHFAHKHPNTSSDTPEVEWMPPPRQVTKSHTHPATQTLGYQQISWGERGTQGLFHTGLSPGLSTLATPTLIHSLGDHRANTGNHMVEQGVRTQRK